jgi:hypothetical protein
MFVKNVLLSKLSSTPNLHILFLLNDVLLFQNQKLLLQLFKSNYSILETLLSILKWKIVFIEDGNLMVLLIVANIEIQEFSFTLYLSVKGKIVFI